VTYAQAHQKIIDWLAARGWTLSDSKLKIRHATSPDGTVRLWFKPQAIHFTVFADTKHVFGNARRAMSITWDERGDVAANVDRACEALLLWVIGKHWRDHTKEST